MRKIQEVKFRNITLLDMKLDDIEKKGKEMHRVVDEMIENKKTECRSYSFKLSMDIKDLEDKIQREGSANK